jgi:hypothetical protein
MNNTIRNIINFILGAGFMLLLMLAGGICGA